MSYLDIFGRAGVAILSVVTICSPALAWRTTLQFGDSGSVSARVGSLSGPSITIKRINRAIEVKDCTRTLLPDCKISWNGQDVWISAASLKDIDMTYARQTSIRRSPSKAAEAKGVVPRSSVVLVRACETHWCEISWKKKRGWVRRDDLYKRANTKGAE